MIIYGLLLAGGVGIRTQSTLPKQFTTYNSQTVLGIATNNLFQGGCNKVIICAPYAYLDIAKTIIRADPIINKTQLQQNQIIIIPGGIERIDSIRIGIEYIQHNQQHSTPSAAILIHDAARPFVPTTDIQRLVHEFTNSEIQLKTHTYIQYITPLTGGLIYMNNNDSINNDKVLNRNDYYELVTPIIISLQLVIEIINNPEFCSEFIPLLQKSGIEYKLITPHDPGMFRKITWPSDISHSHSN